jgi:Na+-driven multidrug efflux pump
MIKDMTSGKTTSVLIHFTVPLVLGNLLQLTYNAVDSAIVGNYVGTKGLAAVGCTNPLMNLAILFISGMCMGAGILMSMSFRFRRYPQGCGVSSPPPCSAARSSA